MNPMVRFGGTNRKAGSRSKAIISLPLALLMEDLKCDRTYNCLKFYASKRHSECDHDQLKARSWCPIVFIFQLYIAICYLFSLNAGSMPYNNVTIR